MEINDSDISNGSFQEIISQKKSKRNHYQMKNH